MIEVNIRNVSVEYLTDLRIIPRESQSENLGKPQTIVSLFILIITINQHSTLSSTVLNRDQKYFNKDDAKSLDLIELSHGPFM